MDHVHVALISDTHSPRFWKGCPPAVAAQLEGVDLILHAGDVCGAETLEELSSYAPILVALGNNDGPDVEAWGATEVVERILEGVRVAVVHDSGPATGRGPRLRRRFPDADLVVFGHSHIPWDATWEGQRQVNPGSPTDKRRQPHGTVGRLVVEDGRIADLQIVPVS